MKNIHVLPTDKPSRVRIGNNGNFVIGLSQNATVSKNDSYTNQNIYITSDEYVGLSYYLDGNLVRKGVVDDKDYWEVRKDYKKIILTTDQDLIKDGVQAIDDEFLEWFVKNPSCKNVVIGRTFMDIITGEPIRDWSDYIIIIPKEELNQETLEEAMDRLYNYPGQAGILDKHSFMQGAFWQAKKMYIEEEVYSIIRMCLGMKESGKTDIEINEKFEQLKRNKL